MAMAKRGLRSLTTAVSIPLSLTLVTIYFSGATDRYRTLPKPFWFPPLWAVHATSMASSLLMGLSAWLVWAEGGFHKSHRSPAFRSPARLELDPRPDCVRIRRDSGGVGGMHGTVWGLGRCARMFREVNPIAGDLVKPCLAWTAMWVL
ncbi:Translocator protein-like [Vitis vinifera]|uniref:Translocator protein-like n=1 Tax=Vitis vinifera TaxID=29760 RepID=A0A438F4I4_VITVI|nr:Translocator protein-like [Vitis vinifera]